MTDAREAGGKRMGESRCRTRVPAPRATLIQFYTSKAIEKWARLQSHMQALERLETLREHATLPPLTVHKFIEYLKTMDTHATHEDREDCALAILVCGLGKVDCNEQWNITHLEVQEFAREQMSSTWVGIGGIPNLTHLAFRDPEFCSIFGHIAVLPYSAEPWFVVSSQLDFHTDWETKKYQTFHPSTYLKKYGTEDGAELWISESQMSEIWDATDPHPSRWHLFLGKHQDLQMCDVLEKNKGTSISGIREHPYLEQGSIYIQYKAPV
ncbi:hypothetical protein B0H14DRAFT_2592224 [Mycena olivaceomarginata]|nr:hypothetical protein B0H14DRAFT_2592224 [Mycena olivaceomarginata]